MSLAHVLTIPWVALAHDNHRLTPARGRLITSSTYRRAKDDARLLFAAQWRRPLFTAPVELRATAWFPDARKRDAGNYRKLLTDALTGVVYADDSLVWRETWERGGIDRTRPRIELSVWAYDTPRP